MDVWGQQGPRGCVPVLLDVAGGGGDHEASSGSQPPPQPQL